MNQLDRIEAMLLNQGRLLVALADLAEKVLPRADLNNPSGLRSKDFDELRRAVADVAPWRRT